VSDGFTLDRQIVSHQRYRHRDRRRVTVSFHRPGETFEIKTLKSVIEREARWEEQDLKRLRLLFRRFQNVIHVLAQRFQEFLLRCVQEEMAAREGAHSE
jgi:predicted RNA binding protein YcfA (HicA-like mRNA interferase family)